MINALYIYGYGSHATNNRSCGLFNKYLNPQVQVSCFDYTQHDCAQAREEIIRYIADNNIQLLIGSSLGAFLALTIPDVPKIVCNPCWSPSFELPKIGCPIEVSETYRPFEPLLEQLAGTTFCRGFFSWHDELLEDRYVEPFTRLYGTPERIDSPHRISEDAVRLTIAPQILSCIGSFLSKTNV